MNLLSFGEIIWDVYGEDQRTLGGAPLNFAAYASLFGANVWLCSAVGTDELGEIAIEEIKKLGIQIEYISTEEKKVTGQCRINLDKNGIPSYNILEDVAYDRIALPHELPRNFDAIAFGTLALRNAKNRETLGKILKGNVFSEIYTDLNIRPPFYSEESIDFCLSNATIVKISDEELPTVTQTLFDKTLCLNSAAISIAEKYPQIKLLLITCGGAGAYCYDCLSGERYFYPAKSASVVSTVGAGDSFGATFLTQYERTRDIPQALELSARVSAFVVAHKEAVPAGIKDFIKQTFSNEKSVT